MFCRTLLTAHSGRGIVIANAENELVKSPLYVRYVKKKQEFRVHVFNGKVIDVQEKRKKSEFDGERNTQIRNLDNGYVFCRDNVVEPNGLRDMAIKTVQCLGLTFGAVDMIYNQKTDKNYVLEVNCAPGLEGTTIKNYGQAILDLSVQ